MKVAISMLATAGLAIALGTLSISSAAACPDDGKKPSLSVAETDNVCPGDKKPSFGCPDDKKPSFGCPDDKKPSLSLSCPGDKKPS
jgi:hypothetical protein